MALEAPRAQTGRALHWLRIIRQAPRTTPTDIRPARRAAAALLAA